MIRTILIADDSPIARKILKSCLPKNHTYDLHEVGDGRAAVEKYREIVPDLTFLDLTMPVMDGIEALRLIKEMDKRAIVIVATADIQKRTIDKITELGAFLLLKKPPSKDAVLEALTEVETELARQ